MSRCPLTRWSLVLCLAGEQLVLFSFSSSFKRNILPKQKSVFAFVNQEKTFDRVPCDNLWWARQYLDIPEWLVNTIQVMYTYASKRVWVNKSISDSFKVQVGVYQGSVLSLLLLTTVLEALSREFHNGYPRSFCMQIISHHLRLAGWPTEEAV